LWIFSGNTADAAVRSALVTTGADATQARLAQVKASVAAVVAEEERAAAECEQSAALDKATQARGDVAEAALTWSWTRILTHHRCYSSLSSA